MILVVKRRWAGVGRVEVISIKKKENLKQTILSMQLPGMEHNNEDQLNENLKEVFGTKRIK